MVLKKSYSRSIYFPLAMASGNWRMVLYQDHSIVLALQEDTNILLVRWLDQVVFNMHEFELTFHIMMRQIEEYGIKKLLVHPCKMLISLPNDQYREVITLLQSGFAHTHIQKIARLYVDKSPRDLECIAYFTDLLNKMQLTMMVENFDSETEALEWLAKPRKYRPVFGAQSAA